MHNPTISFQGFRIYPRGFLGANVGVDTSFNERPYMGQIMGLNGVLPDQFKPPKVPKEINKNVESLWKMVLDKQGIMGDFDFREKVLTVALNAFGTKDFKIWLDMQVKSPYTGDMHMDFLNDTLQFIQTGQRRMALHSWEAVLSLSAVDANATKAKPEFNDFFVDPFTRRGMNFKLIDVIQRWCANEGGFEDMTQTLHVMFGEIKV